MEIPSPSFHIGDQVIFETPRADKRVVITTIEYCKWSSASKMWFYTLTAWGGNFDETDLVLFDPKQHLTITLKS